MEDIVVPKMIELLDHEIYRTYSARVLDEVPDDRAFEPLVESAKKGKSMKIKI